MLKTWKHSEKVQIVGYINTNCHRVMIVGPVCYGSLPKPQERRQQHDLHQIPLIPLLHSALEIMWGQRTWWSFCLEITLRWLWSASYSALRKRQPDGAVEQNFIPVVFYYSLSVHNAFTAWKNYGSYSKFPTQQTGCFRTSVTKSVNVMQHHVRLRVEGTR